MRQVIEHALVAQHAEYGFRDKAPIVLRERAMLLEKTTEDSVRGLLESEHDRESLSRSLQCLRVNRGACVQGGFVLLWVVLSASRAAQSNGELFLA